MKTEITKLKMEILEGLDSSELNQEEKAELESELSKIIIELAKNK